MTPTREYLNKYLNSNVKIFIKKTVPLSNTTIIIHEAVERAIAIRSLYSYDSECMVETLRECQCKGSYRRSSRDDV